MGWEARTAAGRLLTARGQGTRCSKSHTLPELWTRVRRALAAGEKTETPGQPASLRPGGDDSGKGGRGVLGQNAVAHLGGNHDAGVDQETHGEV